MHLFVTYRIFKNTRKYPLRGYILGSGAPGTPGVMGNPLEQLLLVTSCDSPAGIGASLRKDAKPTNGWTDRRDVGNSILDFKSKVRIKNLEYPFIIKTKNIFLHPFTD